MASSNLSLWKAARVTEAKTKVEAAKENLAAAELRLTAAQQSLAAATPENVPAAELVVTQAQEAVEQARYNYDVEKGRLDALFQTAPPGQGVAERIARAANPTLPYVVFGGLALI